MVLGETGDLETKVELTPDLGLLNIWESPLLRKCS